MKQTLLRIFRVVTYPPPFLFLFLIPLSVLCLLYAFLSENASPIAAYSAYFLSAYTLYSFCFYLPRLVRGVRRFKNTNRFCIRYFSDPRLRVRLALYRQLVYNAAYAALQALLGIQNDSPWFFTLAAYYLLLSFLRFYLLLGQRKGGDAFRMRISGILFLPMNLVLAVMTFRIVFEGAGFRYHEIVTIGLAAYTFYACTMAVVGLVRYRKYKSKLFTATKLTSLVAAGVSLLSLATAMLAAFGEGESDLFRMLITAALGACVTVFALFVAIYMILTVAPKLQKDMPPTEENK